MPAAAWMVVAIMALIFAVAFAWLSVLRHDAFQSHAFDLGNMDQAVWNTLHDRFLRFTDMDVGSRVLTSRLAIHVEPILVLCSLLYLVHPSPSSLLVLQSLVAATGAFPAYLLAYRCLGRPWLSLAFPAAYLLHPSLQGALMDDFHAVTMSAALLLWALYFLAADSVGWFVAAAGAAASTKEEVALLVAVLGLVLAVRRRVAGSVVAACGVAWFLTCVLVIIPHFNPAGHSPYLARYAYLGHGLGGVVAGIARHPVLVLHTLTSGGRLIYLDALLDPLAFLPVVGLPVLLLALPSFVINMLSADPHMYSGFYQYSAEVVPYLIAAAALGVASISRLAASRGTVAAWWMPAVLSALVLLASVASTRVYGFTPLAEGFNIPSVGPHQRLESRILDSIPPDAVVAAADEIEPHLAERRTVYLLPTVHPRNGPAAQYIVLDASIPSLPVQPRTLHRLALKALHRGYGVAAAEDGILLLKRGEPARAPASAFYSFIFKKGSHATPAHVSWEPLHLTALTVYPRSGWINRARPDIHLDTYWRTDRRLNPDARIIFYLSPVYDRRPPPVSAWRQESDSPTAAWLPLHEWPANRTIRLSSLSLLPGTTREGRVDVAIGVQGEGPARGAGVGQTVPGFPHLVRIATIRVEH